jgi:hypothetical protein
MGELFDAQHRNLVHIEETVYHDCAIELDFPLLEGLEINVTMPPDLDFLKERLIRWVRLALRLRFIGLLLPYELECNSSDAEIDSLLSFDPQWSGGWGSTASAERHDGVPDKIQNGSQRGLLVTPSHLLATCRHANFRCDVTAFPHTCH